jgi:hypothetical protein
MNKTMRTLRTLIRLLVPIMLPMRPWMNPLMERNLWQRCRFFSFLLFTFFYSWLLMASIARTKTARNPCHALLTRFFL